MGSWRLTPQRPRPQGVLVPVAHWTSPLGARQSQEARAAEEARRMLGGSPEPHSAIRLVRVCACALVHVCLRAAAWVVEFL